MHGGGEKIEVVEKVLTPGGWNWAGSIFILVMVLVKVVHVTFLWQLGHNLTTFWQQFDNSLMIALCSLKSLALQLQSPSFKPLTLIKEISALGSMGQLCQPFPVSDCKKLDDWWILVRFESIYPRRLTRQFPVKVWYCLSLKCHVSRSPWRWVPVQCSSRRLSTSWWWM